MKKYAIVIFAAAFALACGCSKQEQKASAMPPTPAAMTRAESANEASYISTLGTTASRKSVNVTPQVSGKIVSINFKQGDFVKKGDILAVVDKRPYEAAVKQAEGALSQAVAQYNIDRLQAQRNKPLANAGYVDKQTYDALLAKVKVDEGLIEANKGVLEKAKLDLNWCDVRSPIDGKAGLYNIDAGNIVAAGSSVITSVEDVDGLFVDFVVPSQRLNEVQTFIKKNGGVADMEVSFVENGYGDRVRKAKVSVVLNKMRYDTGTAVLRGELDNSDHLFWPDQPVRVKLLLEKSEKVLIPDVCIQLNAAGSYVYVATPHKDGVYVVRQTHVEEGQLYSGDRREVSNVKAGDFVVTQVSQLRLQAGPFVYRARDDGAIYDASGKILTSFEDMKAFLSAATATATELRAKYFATASLAAAKASQTRKNLNDATSAVSAGKAE